MSQHRRKEKDPDEPMSTSYRDNSFMSYSSVWIPLPQHQALVNICHRHICRMEAKSSVWRGLHSHICNYTQIEVMARKCNNMGLSFHVCGIQHLTTPWVTSPVCVCVCVHTFSSQQPQQQQQQRMRTRMTSSRTIPMNTHTHFIIWTIISSSPCSESHIHETHTFHIRNWSKFSILWSPWHIGLDTILNELRQSDPSLFAYFQICAGLHLK